MNNQKKIVLAQDTIDEGDFGSLIEWLKTHPRLTKGEQTILFEKKWAEIVGCKYAVFVNSGSSANLLMLYALIADNALKNKKVVVPALSWITDISPVIQFGLEPILCDCNMRDLSVDLDHLQRIFEKEQPACLILVPVLGLVPDMQAIANLCKAHDVILLVDNCEGQGSRFDHKSLETFGAMASCSTYFGHIMSTIEGGVVTTDDRNYYNLLKMLRSHGWDRDLEDQDRQALRDKWNIPAFNSMYAFYQTGFNLRATDLQAFIGIRQLGKLTYNIDKRNWNYWHYDVCINNKYWKPVQKHYKNFVSNLGYPVIHPRRDEIAMDLIRNNVEVRPLISGSMGTQPFYVNLYGRKELENVSTIDKYGMYVPNHPMLSKEDVEFISDIINTYTQ